MTSDYLRLPPPSMTLEMPPPQHTDEKHGDGGSRGNVDFEVRFAVAVDEISKYSKENGCLHS